MTFFEPTRAGHETRLLLLLLTVVCAASCSAGSGDGLNISGRPIEEGGDIPLEATLASIQANIFDPSCIVCHSGANAPLGLRLDAANSFTNLVGVQSVQNATNLRVNPGNPDQSYLVHKLEGTASTGTQMPLGGPPVPQATINFVRQWIIDGAQQTSIAATGAAPKVLSLQPDPGSVVRTLPAQITVAFDQAVDASTLNSQTIEVRRSGGDGVFGNGNDVPVVLESVEVSALNAHLVIVILADVTPAEDRYQVTVRGTGPSTVLGYNSVVLDGEYAGALPSGDDISGGDFVASFWLRNIKP